jgi:hypothetical protein
MGSGSKTQETMAKIARERAVKGRRDRPQQQKRAAAAARDATDATGVARQDESDRGVVGSPADAGEPRSGETGPPRG